MTIEEMEKFMKDYNIERDINALYDDMYRVSIHKTFMNSLGEIDFSLCDDKFEMLAGKMYTNPISCTYRMWFREFQECAENDALFVLLNEYLTQLLGYIRVSIPAIQDDFVFSVFLHLCNHYQKLLDGYDRIDEEFISKVNLCKEYQFQKRYDNPTEYELMLREADRILNDPTYDNVRSLSPLVDRFLEMGQDNVINLFG